MNKHILFVEDDVAQQDMFGSAVADWNAAHADEGRGFTYDTEETAELAHAALDRIRFDAALFDLRIRGDVAGPAEAKGNELAREALQGRDLPVAIISANTSLLDDDVRDAGVVKVFDKNDPPADGRNYYDLAIDWLGSQWEMMEVMAAARRTIDASAADIFLVRLWPRSKTYAGLEVGDRAELERIVTRQYVSHMADKLGLDDPANVTWHPFENYVSPALLSDRAHTGDIFRLEGVLWVVLTPQCDMATQKVENVLLASCAEGIDNWDKNLADLKAAASKTSVENASKFLKRLLNQNLEPSKHFLPPLPDSAKPRMVNFVSIMTKPRIDLNGLLDERVASIATPFLSNIVQRFGAYISRTGQPNIDMGRL